MKTCILQFSKLLLLILIIANTLLAQTESSKTIGISPGDAQVTEPMIAVNPTDPNNFITVYSKWVDELRRPASSRTTDGGLTWSSTEVPANLYRYPAPLSERPDPTVAFDANGDAHFCYMDEQKATPYQGFRRDLVVAHSTNKGATWHDTSVVYDYLRYQNPYRVDKPWITADCNPSSPYKNSQYVAFTAIYNWGGNALYSILFSYKRPNGKYTNPVQLRTSVGGTQSVFGAFAVVGIDGTIFVFWGLQTSGSSSIIQMVKSTNGGQSFTLPVTIKSGITESLNVISFLKAHSWPYVAVNPVDGSLNMVYGNGGSVLFSYSTDNGVTWSASEHKGMSPTVASWNPNITCDSNGKLAVVYYATGIRVLVATGYATDETFDVWSQGSLYFSNPYKWTDYIGIACNDYTYWAVWPAPSGEMSKIFGTHRTVSPVIENLDQDYLTFTNDKIIFGGDT